MCGGTAGLHRWILWEPFVTSSYPSPTRALAEAWVDVLWFIDGSEDEQMDPDDPVKVLEGVAHLVSTPSDDPQQELIALVSAMVATETNPARRTFLEEFPEAFGSSPSRPEGFQLAAPDRHRTASRRLILHPHSSRSTRRCRLRCSNSAYPRRASTAYARRRQRGWRGAALNGLTVRAVR